MHVRLCLTLFVGLRSIGSDSPARGQHRGLFQHGPRCPFLLVGWVTVLRLIARFGCGYLKG